MTPPDGALRVLEDALEAARGLGELSERGRVVPEFNDPTLREIFVHRYRLLYRVSVDYVSIVTFLHGRAGLHRLGPTKRVNQPRQANVAHAADGLTCHGPGIGIIKRWCYGTS